MHITGRKLSGFLPVICILVAEPVRVSEGSIGTSDQVMNQGALR